MIDHYVEEGKSLAYILGLALYVWGLHGLDGFDEATSYFVEGVCDLNGGYYTPRLPLLEIQASMREEP
jgi:hypothetical protein